MPCTTVLVGKKASMDGSTMIARTDDGHFDVKKLITVDPQKQPRKYTSIIARLTVDLPNDPMRYTSCPNVDRKEGVWPTTGINMANVGMTATETITTNPRVLGADPLVRFRKAESKKQKDIAGGIGEEDLVLLVLPYIHTAREGVLRLGKLLEQYGTYESNGIAFNDRDEIWWLETIGGHHWIARRVKDEEVVIMPNQFGLDRFDFGDAFGEGKENLCSADLKEFVEKNHLNPAGEADFNPRLCFGSHSDADHVYNTPRAWFMGRYLNPTKYVWDGPDADFTPESDQIPWSFVPERRISIEDVKYILSSHYQGTPYDPYGKGDDPCKGKYRSIGINRTGCMAICQIRSEMPESLQGVEWISFGPTTFDTVLPVYTHTDRIPDYLCKVTLEPTTENFYWASRMIASLAEPHFAACVQHLERYEMSVVSKAREILREYDRMVSETGDESLLKEANEKLCAMAKKETARTLEGLILTTSELMRNGFHRADN